MSVSSQTRAIVGEIRQFFGELQKVTDVMLKKINEKVHVLALAILWRHSPKFWQAVSTIALHEFDIITLLFSA